MYRCAFSAGLRQAELMRAAAAAAGCTVHWCLQTAMQQYGVGRRCSVVVLGGSGDGGAGAMRSRLRLCVLMFGLVPSCNTGGG